MNFKIAVVMATYNGERYIANALDSVINQSLDFKRNIQIIIVNDASTDGTAEIAGLYQRKYPENITLINIDENHGAAHSRNVGLNYVDAEYVNFLDSDDYISEFAFKKAVSLLDSRPDIDIASIPIYYFGSRRGPHILNYKYSKTQVVDLFEKPEFIQLSGASSFFRFSKLKNYRFNDKLKVSEDPLLINQILLENPKMGFVDDCGYFYRKHDTTKSLIGSSANHRSYYTSRVDEYFLKLIDISVEKYGEVPKFIQHILMYDLQWIFLIHFVDFYLSRDEIHELYQKLIYILSFIDEDVIFFQKDIDGLLKTHILLLKMRGKNYLNHKEDVPRPPRYIIEECDLDRVYIDIFQVKNDQLYILGYVTTFFANPEIKILINDYLEIPTAKLNFPQRDNYSVNFNYGINNHFEVYIPLNDLEKISFFTSELKLNIVYNQPSRLSKMSGYMLSQNHLFINHDTYISVEGKNHLNVFKNEMKTLKRILTSRQEGWRTGFLLRILFFLFHPVYSRRKMWIFMDLPYLAQDNAFSLFRYAASLENSGIHKFFAIYKQDSSVHDVAIMMNRYLSQNRKFKIKKLLGLGEAGSEYSKIDKIGPALPYRSMKHRLYSLFAEVIVSSNPDNNIIYPFWDNFQFLAGLVRSKTVFLQHGVTKDDTSDWLNKYDKNLDLIVTVSDAEKESFLSSNYGYDRSVVKVLGFPRFDNLEKKENYREIVVMPTWRRQYNNLNPSEFIKTEFFRVFNKLLNDEELIEFLDAEGYKMVFKPHPNLMKFMNLFSRHPLVDFRDYSYEEIFNHASLLVTDYSSVFFDFAYLEKPVIYYHYGSDYHFDVENGYFKYDSMGFGQVAKTHEEVKNDIIAVVLNGCEMDDMYRKRVEDFFYYHDRRNSERVFDAIFNMDFDY